MKQDSLDKIAGYLQVCAAHSFEYKGRTIVPPSRFVMSPMFFRDYTCPAGCGGCCPQFSLDYFMSERTDRLSIEYPEFFSRLHPRAWIINGTAVPVWTFSDHGDGHFCSNLDKSGRCGIHVANPFSCSFELMKLTIVRGTGFLTKRLFGRGWSYARIDGGKGALCQMVDLNVDRLYGQEVGLLEELRDIGSRAGILTYLDKVIAYLKQIEPDVRQGRVPTRVIQFHPKVQEVGGGFFDSEDELVQICGL